MFNAYVLYRLTILIFSYYVVLAIIIGTFFTNTYFFYILIKYRVSKIHIFWRFFKEQEELKIWWILKASRKNPLFPLFLRLLYGLHPHTFILEFNPQFETNMK